MINISGNSLSKWVESGIEDKKNFLYVNSCGYQRFISKNLRIEREAGRVDYQAIYIFKGKGYYKFDSRIIEIGEGNILFYNPLVPQLYTYNFTDKTELYWVHFTGFSVTDLLQKMGLFDKHFYYIGYSNEIIELFKKIINELQLKRPSHESYAAAHLLEVLSVASRKLTDSNLGNNSVINSDIKTTIDYMYSKYNQNYSVSEYAKICNLSLYRFIHKFKAATGLTPVEYLTRIRINEAKDLLSYSSLSISEVSSIVGYDNQLYFSRVFKKVIGVPPSFYKKHSV